MKNKLAFFKLADGVEILVQDVSSSLAVIQTKEDVWLAEGLLGSAMTNTPVGLTL